ncbi:AMP-binding protein [Aliiglaciecola lipolytica]|uniref:AMP-dependent synthetase/ligase domain-containing protein n=1 Tax=Aliiglaciecola lipolytica E3 TaxID=1127673 RepID=K6WXE3_9ALTE|nr:AMP-binding protein [Aliiglaciecola lipolytica]GAC13129.1 hypothetical protein GLIP_0483 [Aliiglaciecola lipolytica E3]
MSESLTLSNWMSIRPNQVIAIRSGQVISSAEFTTNVARWKNLLAQHSGHRWVVYHSDPYEFLSILYALWYLQRIACVPGDNRPATIARLSNKVDGMIGEISQGIALGSNDDYLIEDNFALHELDGSQIAVELYTSGSSGAPKAITKTIAQLQSELASLQKQWPAVSGAVILSTVSHQHLYGLTFRLLRPFIAGQPILCELCEYTEDIYNFAQDLCQFVLVSSPSHISRVNELLDWSSLNALCVNIFSAAAPLERNDALRMSKLLSAPLWEIYGSSETGVIAWRSQAADTEQSLWQKLPDVEFEFDPNEQVKVCSPFTDPQHSVLSDKLKVYPNGCFELQGRSDNIVKIEGKRVSLTAIENALCEHSWISEIRAFVVIRKRTEVAIALVLSHEGEIQLMRSGRQFMIKTLRAQLLSKFETIVVPRRWRFIDTMPYNQQGKITLESLQNLVEQPALLKWPTIKNIKHDSSNLLINCTMPKELLYFDGHFENAPILPGVVQVHWAQKYAVEYFNISQRFSHLEVIKFSHVIQPEEEIEIAIEFNQQKRKVMFSYRSAIGLHSSGRICFE